MLHHLASKKKTCETLIFREDDSLHGDDSKCAKGEVSLFQKRINFIPDLVCKFVFFQIHLFSILDVLIFSPSAFALILTFCQLG